MKQSNTEAVNVVISVMLSLLHPTSCTHDFNILNNSASSTHTHFSNY